MPTVLTIAFPSFTKDLSSLRALPAGIHLMPVCLGITSFKKQHSCVLILNSECAILSARVMSRVPTIYNMRDVQYPCHFFLASEMNIHSIKEADFATAIKIYGMIKLYFQVLATFFRALQQPATGSTGFSMSSAIRRKSYAQPFSALLADHLKAADCE